MASRVSVALVVAAVATGLLGPVAHAEKPGALSPQTLKLPTGPASLKGLGESFSPNIALGGGSYSVPIQVPPALLAPSVSLSYSSGRGKGVLGLGWSLGVLKIYRTTDKGLPRFAEEDRFAVQGPSLNDELVLVDPVTRTYRLKNEGAFALFVRDVVNDTWVIRLPSGESLLLGASSQSRQQSSRGTYRWFLERKESQFCHATGSACETLAIEYDYFRDSNHVYLSAIRYQLYAPEHQNRVDFIYDPQDRPDVFSDYTYGHADTTRRRLQRIDVNHGSRLLRHYDLTYEDQDLFSVLSSVTLTGEHGEQMPVLRFRYVQPNDRGTLRTMQHTPPLEGLVDGRSTLEDVTGDGLPDLLIGEPDAYRYYENLDGLSFAATATTVSNPPDRGLEDPDTLLADINGDGFRDLVHPHDTGFRFYPGGTIREGVFLGFGAAQALIPASGTLDAHFGSPQVRLTDLNFDGRTDWLLQTPGGVQEVLNTETNRLQASATTALPADIDFNDPSLMLTDFNGDGHLDFVLVQIDWTRGRVRVWLGTGEGRFLAEQTVPVSERGDPGEFFLQDVNRDGQADLLRISGSTVHYYLNTGKMRFTTARGDYLGVPATYQTLKQMFADMNGNGTADIVWVTQDHELRYLDLLAEPHFGLLTEVDNGMGQVTTIEYDISTQYMIDAKAAGGPWKTPMASPMPVVRSISVSDSFDRLGLPENVTLTRFTYRDGYYDGKEREFRGFAHVISESVGDEEHPSLVTETWLHVGRNLETGEDEEILKGKAYQQVTRAVDGTVYGSVETVWERRFLCQERDLPAGSARVLPICADFGSADQWHEHKDELVAYAEQRAALTGTWEGRGADEARYTYATTDEVDAWGNALKATSYGEVTFIGAHDVGSPFEITDLDLFGSKRNGGMTYNDEVVTRATFINDPGEWLLKLPETSQTEDYAGTVLTRQEVRYDGPICDSFPCDASAFEGLALGEVTRGRPARKSAWLSYAAGAEDRWVAVERTAYNRAGQPIETLDANDNQRGFAYDPETGTFLVEEGVCVEASGCSSQSGWLSYSATYDTGFGQIETATDYNGQLSQFDYDSLGRVTKIADALSSLAEPTQRFMYTYGTQANPVSVTLVEQLVQRADGATPASYHRSWVYSDGLGRQRLTKTEAEAPHDYVASGWQELSARGKPVRVYEAFASSYAGLSGLQAAPESAPMTRTMYDALDRPLRVYPPVTDHGETYTRTDYLPWETRVFDERDAVEGDNPDYPAISRLDGLGRLVDIIKYNDVDNALTELHWRVEYDLLGNITAIVDPKDNVRSYAYDSFKRLRHITDPNAGALTYVYDDAGNLLERTDARGYRLEMHYQAANRLEARYAYEDGDVDPAASYAFYYDAPASTLLPDAQNLLGQVSRITSPIGEMAFSYDAVGRLGTTVQSLIDPDFPADPPDVFRADTTYDPQAKVLSESLPGGMTYTYGYNARQTLSSFVAQLDGGGTYTGSFAYDARGLPIRSDYGDGLGTCRYFDARARLREGRTVPVSELGDPSLPGAGCGTPGATSPSDIVNRLYDYTPTGLISQITDLSPDRPELPKMDGTYEYDRLYQLTSATTQAGLIEYQYDTIQNLLSRTVSDPLKGPPAGTLSYDGVGPNQVTAAFGETYTYDAAGYMQSYNGYALTWDVEGRLVRAESSRGEEIRWYYDFAGERRLKIVSESGAVERVTKYPFGTYQERDGSPTWTLTAGGSMLGEVTRAPKPIPSLSELDSLITYGYDSGSGLPPDPWQADAASLEAALESFWDGQPVGPSEEVGRYFHRDHLGGPAHVTSTTGELVAYTVWHPYGLESVTRGFQPNYTFTGAEREHERDLGLIQMGARWYAPGLGRWVSADPFFLENPEKGIGSPLELNLYSYAANNPVAFTDPMGLESVGELIERKGVEAAQEDRTLATAGWAFAQAAWDWFGAEGVSQVADKGTEASGGSMVSAAAELAGVVPGGKVVGKVVGKVAGKVAGKVGGKVVGKAAGKVMAKARAVLAKATRKIAPKAGQTSRILGRTAKQLQKKFKHAGDFGVKGGYSKANAAKFSEAIHKHINSPGVRSIQGTYHKNPVTHYLDPSTGLNVMADPAGNFISGWRLNPAQLQNVLTHGGL